MPQDYADNPLESARIVAPKEVIDRFRSAYQPGLRHNADKNRLDLMPPEWEEALGDVLTQGAKKYADNNWLKGMDWGHMISSMKRHVLKWRNGETHDDETGCHHLAMVAWNALALMTYELRGLGDDTRVIPDKYLKPINSKHDIGSVVKVEQDGR